MTLQGFTQHRRMTENSDVPQPNMDETIPTNLSQPKSDTDPDATIPMTNVDNNRTVPTGIDTDQMDTIGMAPTLPGAFNDSDTAATQLSPHGSGGSSADNFTGQIWGDFELGKKIGQGGMGAVYLGRQISLDRPVAIKVLPSNLSHDPNFRKRFELEAKAVAQITCPFIIQVYGAGEANGHSYFAMEFVEGKDLGERIKDGLRPKPEEAADYILQAAKGLAAAGEHNLIHRDIKPGNMMLTNKGELKIMDFGLVKLKNEDGSSGGGLTMAGAVMGTVNYFSPEQGRGEECDQTTDIYALGIVFYQLLAGTLPFTGSDATSIIYQHIHSEPRPLKDINPTVPEAYQAIVTKCIQKDRRKRYQTAKELMKDIELTLGGAKPQHAPIDEAETKSPSSVADKKGSNVGVVLLLLLIIGGGVGWYFWDQNNKKQQQDPVVNNGGGQDPINETDHVPLGNVDPLTKAGDLLGRGELDQADILITQFLSKDPGNEKWLDLSKRLRDERAELAINDARKAVSVEEFELAAASLDKAEELGGDELIIEELRRQIREHSGLATQLSVIRSHLRAGLPKKAIAELDKLGVGDARGDAKILKDLRRTAEQMSGELETAHKTLASGDVDTARGLFQASLTAYPNEAARAGLKALGPASAINRAIDDNQLALANEQLRELIVFIPDSPAVPAIKERILLVEIFVAGKQMAKRGELGKANEELAKLEKLVPNSARGKELKSYINEKKILADFRSAIAAKDLPDAKAKMELLKKQAPESESVKIARKEFEESKIVEEAARQERERFEKQVADKVKRIETLIGQRQPDFSNISQELAGLADLAGTDRKEIPVLKKKIEDRKAEIGVASSLKELDKAVLEGRSDDIAKYVSDDKFVAVLGSFVGKKDLVFEHTIKVVKRQSQTVTLDAVLRNGYDVAPENDININYTLKLQGPIWRITAYAIKP